jgi:hypothetical protein
MPWAKQTWVDDDGSLTVGTAFTAARMNNIELGVDEALTGMALRVLKSTLENSGTGFVQHGTNAATARPTGYAMVVWVGSVEPTNATATDLVVYENSAATHVPSAKVYKAAGQAIPTATITTLTFDSERYDNAGIHSTASNTSRLTAPKAGVYLIAASVAWASNATGERFVQVSINGSPTQRLAGQRSTASGGFFENSIAAVHYLKAGDYVEIAVYQTSGGSLATSDQGSYLAPQEASLTWVGSGLESEGNVDWGIVSALPVGAALGDTCLFKAATGVYWQLQYTGEAIYPWAKIGGPPLVARSDTGRALTNQVAYASLPTDPLKIVAPLKGDYDIRIEAAIESPAVVSSLGGHSYSVGATAANDNWAGFGWSAGAATTFLDGGKTTRHFELAALAEIIERARTGGAYTVTFYRRRLVLDPVRVG